MVDVTVALMRVSIAAALSAIPPQPQMPIMPILFESTFFSVERKSTAAQKSSVLMSGDATKRGVPPLSPVNEGSNAIAKKPRSAISCAYKPDDCSFTAPKGPHTAMAASLPL